LPYTQEYCYSRRSNKFTCPSGTALTPAGGQRHRLRRYVWPRSRPPAEAVGPAAPPFGEGRDREPVSEGGPRACSVEYVPRWVDRLPPWEAMHNRNIPTNPGPSPPLEGACLTTGHRRRPYVRAAAKVERETPRTGSARSDHPAISMSDPCSCCQLHGCMRTPNRPAYRRSEGVLRVGLQEW